MDRGTALWKLNRSLELTSQDTGKIDYVGENVGHASAHVVTVESGRVTERIFAYDMSDGDQRCLGENLTDTCGRDGRWNFPCMATFDVVEFWCEMEGRLVRIIDVVN